MLDLRTQSQLVDATAAMVRSCITATTYAWVAAACRGLAAWTEMLAATPWQPAAGAYPIGRMMLWPSAANWMTAPQLYAWPAWPWLPGADRTVWAPFAGTWAGPSFSLWMPLADRGTWSRASAPASNGRDDALPAPPVSKAKPQAPAMRPTSPTGYSSYRSTGGHAVAQIAAAPATGRIEPTATAALTLSPMHTMLGVWRAALGV